MPDITLKPKNDAVLGSDLRYATFVDGLVAIVMQQLSYLGVELQPEDVGVGYLQPNERDRTAYDLVLDIEILSKWRRIGLRRRGWLIVQRAHRLLPHNNGLRVGLTLKTARRSIWIENTDPARFYWSWRCLNFLWPPIRT
jgi:hypothetical protein